MAFFQFGRKLEVSKGYSLDEIPVFASLTPSEQRVIQKQARLVEYKKGDLIYEEGTPPEFFYVVVSGRYRLFRKARGNQKEETLHYFYRGDHFGETSLLNARPHSACVEAKRDGVILQLPKNDFLKILKEFPSISLHLNRSLGHRLTKNLEDTGRHEVKIVTLYTPHPKKEASLFWVDFAGSIMRESKGKAVLVDFVSEGDPLITDEFGSSLKKFHLSPMDPFRESDLSRCLVTHSQGFEYLGVVIEDFSDALEKKLSALVAFLTSRCGVVLLRIPEELNELAYKLLKKSDFVYVYTAMDPMTFSPVAATLEEFEQRFGFSKNEIRLVLTENGSGQRLFLDEQERLLSTYGFSILPSRDEKPERYQNMIRYLSRELTGSLLGLALGSGAAYGLAHIGVLKVLEEERIFPDVIAGSSIGALIAVLWASGYDASQIEAIAKQLDKSTTFFKLIGFRDLALFGEGFLKGNRIKKFLESYLGHQTFQDLKVPVKVVAADLFTSEEIVIETGSLAEAIRSSISIPGIFRPVPHQGRYLIDGGVIDPLPVRVLAKLGVKKIIAVNVLSGPDDRIKRNQIRRKNSQIEMEELQQMGPVQRFWSRSLHKVSSRYAVNIFNVIMSTVQFMEFELANSSGEQADILIHPVVPGGHWAEFYSPEKFIRTGEERTREQIAEIKRLLTE